MASELLLILRVLMGMAFGAAIGLERELKDKPAGLRTHILVSGAAVLLVMMAAPLIESITVGPDVTIRSDPVRIIEAIIVGVGFIGAGTIWKANSEEHVKHISTAASILFTAGIGIAVGVGFYYVAAALTLVLVVVMHLLEDLEDRLH